MCEKLYLGDERPGRADDVSMIHISHKSNPKSSDGAMVLKIPRSDPGRIHALNSMCLKYWFVALRCHAEECFFSLRNSAKQNVVRLSSIYPKRISRARLFSPVDFTDSGGTTVPFSGGLVCFVALRCYAEECAFSLSTQAQDHVLDLAEYMRAEPARCPTSATSGVAGRERKLL